MIDWKSFISVQDVQIHTSIRGYMKQEKENVLNHWCQVASLVDGFVVFVDLPQFSFDVLKVPPNDSYYLLRK